MNHFKHFWAGLAGTLIGTMAIVDGAPLSLSIVFGIVTIAVFEFYAYETR